MQIVGELEDLLGRALGEGLGQLAPGGITDFIPEPQERTQVGRATAGEEGGGDGGVAVGVALPFEQAERHHGVGVNARGAAGQAGAGRQSIEGGGRVGQGFEEAKFVGCEEELGRHEAGC